MMSKTNKICLTICLIAGAVDGMHNILDQIAQGNLAKALNKAKPTKAPKNAPAGANVGREACT